MEPAKILILCLAAAAAITGTAFTLISLREGEARAAARSSLVSILIISGLLSTLLLKEELRTLAAGVMMGLLLLAGAAFLLPIGKADPELSDPASQVDERQIIFARARLIPGSANYQAYYQAHPEHQALDDRSRAQPGLLSPQARFTDPLHSASAEGSFSLTEALRDAVDGPTGAELVNRSADDFTSSVKFLAAYYGARDCGIAELKPYHIYSHIGRGSGSYGDPVRLEHAFAIAFTVEMDFQLTAAAPYPPITMESGRQYVEAARVAVQLAAAIRSLGYPARAHIDGNYRVIAPLVARDAGLGEIGRMGLLMTPRLGPRVRIGVVTTDLPLVADRYQPDPAVLDFCQICQKCAQNCPSQAIPDTERQLEDGVLRWRIDPETCYHYWTVIGTDCGRCLAVCPYSHPDNWIHNLVRWGNSRSGAFRRLALALDDFFYGAKPGPRNQSILPPA